MVKMRRGSNKSKSGITAQKQKKRTGTSNGKLAKVKKQRAAREAAALSRLPSRTAFEGALTRGGHEVRYAGRAIVLLHGAGGSSAHASMRAWKARLSSCCDEVLAIDFPKGDERDLQPLTACVAEAVARATDKQHKHTRVLIAGVGNGARIAMHLLAAVDEVQPLSATLRAAVVGVVALSFPLLRGSTRQVRDEPLRSLGADAPPVLFVSGARDGKMDFGQFEAVRRACRARTQLHMVEGADQALRPPSEHGVEALDAALHAFIGAELGSRQSWSVPLPAAAAAPLSKKNRKHAATPAKAQQDLRHAGQQPLSKAKVKRMYIEVRGAGTPQVNGTYRHHGIRDGVASYKQMGGGMTIERDSGTQWCICMNFGFTSWCFVNSTSRTPPTTGWSVGACAAPAPTLRFLESVQRPCSVPLATSQPSDSTGQGSDGALQDERPAGSGCA